jgi:hypothetical protein
MEHAIGWNRMPNGITTFVGLPAGTYTTAIFSADNNPGFGDGTVEIKPATHTTIELNWVAAWSNGMHLPPPDLEPIVDAVEASDIRTPAQLVALFESQGVPFPKPETMLEYLSMASKLIGQPITLTPDSEPISADRLLAAFGYISMKGSLDAEGRTPNPWRAPVVTTVPIVKAKSESKTGG